MAAYYNEFDEGAAAWLRELIRRALIAPGDVDTRSIVDVQPDDLRGYTQCHFFAGIGVWSYALRRAGWSDDRPVWTGSPPCQPFSDAGKGLGLLDERHLWPAFFHLIDVCRPNTFFGEQVASKAALEWLDHVSADVEGAGYAFGAFDLCAAGFGAPHIRQRLKFVGTRALADPVRARLERHCGHGDDSNESGRIRTIPSGPIAEIGADGGLALPDDAFWRANLSRGDFDNRSDTGRPQGAGHVGSGGTVVGMADADRQFQRGVDRVERNSASGGKAEMGLEDGQWDGAVYDRGGTAEFDGAGPTNGFWGDADWLFCRDGKWRPVEPGTFPLAHGAAARMGRLRGYGNAIVAPAAEGFIASFLEAEQSGFAVLDSGGGVDPLDGVLG